MVESPVPPPMATMRSGSIVYRIAGSVARMPWRSFQAYSKVIISKGPNMNRRALLKSLAGTSVAGIAAAPAVQAALPKMKITRVRVYSPPNPNPLFNQSDLVITVETDGGITGIGEGGSRDTLEQCAGRLIGRDPQYIERLWQDMYRSFFYPPGREKMH